MNTVFQCKGLKRGVIKEALIEAMELWIKSDVIKKDLYFVNRFRNIKFIKVLICLVPLIKKVYVNK